MEKIPEGDDIMNIWQKISEKFNRKLKRVQKERCMAMTAVIAKLGDPCLTCYNQHCPNHPDYLNRK